MHASVLTLAAPRSINVGPSPIVYIDLRITDTRNGRIPTGLEKKNSTAVQTATAIQRRTENNGESVPTQGRERNFGKSVLHYSLFFC